MNPLRALIRRREARQGIWFYSDGMMDPDDVARLPGLAIPVAGDPRDIILHWPTYGPPPVLFDWELDVPWLTP